MRLHTLTIILSPLLASAARFSNATTGVKSWNSTSPNQATSESDKCRLEWLDYYIKHEALSLAATFGELAYHAYTATTKMVPLATPLTTTSTQTITYPQAKQCDGYPRVSLSRQSATLTVTETVETFWTRKTTEGVAPTQYIREENLQNGSKTDLTFVMATSIPVPPDVNDRAAQPTKPSCKIVKDQCVTQWDLLREEYKAYELPSGPFNWSNSPFVNPNYVRQESIENLSFDSLTYLLTDSPSVEMNNTFGSCFLSNDTGRLYNEYQFQMKEARRLTPERTFPENPDRDFVAAELGCQWQAVHGVMLYFPPEPTPTRSLCAARGGNQTFPVPSITQNQPIETAMVTAITFTSHQQWGHTSGSAVKESVWYGNWTFTSPSVYMAINTIYINYLWRGKASLTDVLVSAHPTDVSSMAYPPGYRYHRIDHNDVPLDGRDIHRGLRPYALNFHDLNGPVPADAYIGGEYYIEDDNSDRIITDANYQPLVSIPSVITKSYPILQECRPRMEHLQRDWDNQNALKFFWDPNQSLSPRPVGSVETPVVMPGMVNDEFHSVPTAVAAEGGKPAPPPWPVETQSPQVQSSSQPQGSNNRPPSSGSSGPGSQNNPSGNMQPAGQGTQPSQPGAPQNGNGQGDPNRPIQGQYADIPSGSGGIVRPQPSRSGTNPGSGSGVGGSVGVPGNSGSFDTSSSGGLAPLPGMQQSPYQPKNPASGGPMGFNSGSNSGSGAGGGSGAGRGSGSGTGSDASSGWSSSWGPGPNSGSNSGSRPQSGGGSSAVNPSKKSDANRIVTWASTFYLNMVILLHVIWIVF